MKVITIGRNQDNDIVVNDERASRSHLQIVQSHNGNYSVVDLGSANGTFVNGQRITSEVQLQPNDEIVIGTTMLPWQSYFVEQLPTEPQPPTEEEQIEEKTKPKTKRIVWYIAAAIVLLLLLIGGVALYKYNEWQKEIATERAEAKKDAIKRFEYLENRIYESGYVNGEIYFFLREMQQIADRFPNHDHFQKVIQELKNQ